MSQHPDARLTPRGREAMVARVEAGEPVSEVARQMGASGQTASKWVGRARRGAGVAVRPGVGQRGVQGGGLDAYVDHHNWDRPLKNVKE